MQRLRLSENLKLAIIGGITLICINLWSFQIISEDIFNILEVLAMAALIVIVCFTTKVFLYKGLAFKKFVLLFFFLPLLSVVGANIYHDQPLSLSFLLLRSNLVWLLYFVLHIYNVSPQRLLKFVLFVGIVWAFLTTAQQFTYPVAYFYTRGEDSASLFRGDIVRYGIAGQQFGVFALLYFTYRYLTTKNIYTLPFAGLALLGLYYTGGRQTLAASFACIIVAVLLLEGISKWTYLIMFSILGVLVILVLQPAMIMNMISLTDEQVNNKDYIRFHSANFYLNEYWPHWGAKLLGNGRPHELCNYGVEMNYIQKVLHFFRSDVGIIGVYNTYGLFYVLTIFAVNIKGMFMRLRDREDKYLKPIFFYTFFTLLLNVSYAGTGNIPFFCLLYYIADKALEKEETKETYQEKATDNLLVPAIA